MTTMMTNSGRAKVTTPSDTQILIVREFDAPRPLVFRAWTTPELIKRWWSGQRGTCTHVETDLRVGGRWRYVMVTHGGYKVAFHGEYREIVPDERIVSTEVFEGIPNAEDHATLNTATFTEANGRTTLTILVEHPTRAGRDAMLASGMEGGLQEALDLLEQTAKTL
jgi:uncharacterized protein YndB with AHSA1/START domain